MLTLQISMKIDVDDKAGGETIFKIISTIFPNAEITLNNKTDKTLFNWDEEVVIKQPSDDEYKAISNDLYEQLIANMARFTDWEYKFISDMYRKSTENETYSKGQKEWIDKLKEKYL